MCNAHVGACGGPLTNEIHVWVCIEGCVSLFVLGYHWLLPLATKNLVGDNREFDI